MIRGYSFQENCKIRQNIIALRQRLFPGTGGWKRCAHAFNVPPRTWYGWENGTEHLGPDSVARIADFFGVTPDLLLLDKIELPYLTLPRQLVDVDIPVGLSPESTIVILDKSHPNPRAHIHLGKNVPEDAVDEITRLALVIRAAGLSLSEMGYYIKVEMFYPDPLGDTNG